MGEFVAEGYALPTKGTCVVSDFECKAPAGWGTAAGYATNNLLRVATVCSHCEEFEQTVATRSRLLVA